MTVKELKQQLENLPDDMVVMVENNTECGFYMEVAVANPNHVYVPEGKRSYGYIYPINWTADYAGYDEDEWEKIISQPKVLVLLPPTHDVY